MNSVGLFGFLSSLSDQWSKAAVVPALSHLLVKLVGYTDNFQLVAFALSLIL